MKTTVTKTISLLLVCVLLAMSQVACTSQDVTVTLAGLVNAAAAAADIAFPQDAVLINAVVNTCADPAIATLEGLGTPLEKAVTILAACTPLLTQLNSSRNLAALAAALTAFLNAVKLLESKATTSPADAQAILNKISSAQLSSLHSRLSGVKAKLTLKK